ncbi:MAG: restriction endonuclease subunit S [Planctomycetaceae bacterium]
MSFPRYPKYKASGVEWLGDVPEHWHLDRMKWSTRSCKNGIWSDEAKQDENDIPCVRVADFDRQRLRVELDEPTMRNVSASERVGRVLRQGDLLLEKSGGGEGQPVGCVVLYDDPKAAVCSNFVAKVEVAPGMNSSFWRYLHAAAYSVRLNTRSIKQTSGIQNLDQQQYLDEIAAFPSEIEQTKIASFLDRETSKIDGLVGEQRRLMELLKEKRQAVISHAVTKGLNPHAPLKPSGIEWLGDVPEHWRLIRLRHACSHIFLGLTTTVDYVDEGGVPLVRALNINGGVLDLSEVKFISETQHRSLTKRNRAIRGDVLLSKSGSIGTAAVVDSDVEFSIYESIFALRARPELLTSRYLLQLLRSQACLSQYSASLVGMGVGHLNMSDIVEVWAALPPLDEQEQIAKVIEDQTARFDALTAEAERGIELLQERRTALISAAVTGQIDVRGLVATEAA